MSETEAASIEGADHSTRGVNADDAAASRKATGNKLVYTAADQKAVLTGSNARVEDAEQGTTQGAELTFFVGGDRVRVAGQQGAGRVRTTHRIRGGGKQ